jgi:hypothetical protein
MEFDYFVELAIPAIPGIVRSISRFGALENVFSFYVSATSRDTLEARFGFRSMFRQTVDGNAAAENGATLLYSFGPNGVVAVVLYPVVSDFGRPFEDQIYIRIGKYTAFQLFDRLSRDLKDLVAYSYVTSMDADPTLWEKTRIQWLRKMHPTQLKGEFTSASIFRHGHAAFEFTMRTMLVALLRPLGIILVIVLLIYFGMPQLAALLKH